MNRYLPLLLLLLWISCKNESVTTTKAPPLDFSLYTPPPPPTSAEIAEMEAAKRQLDSTEQAQFAAAKRYDIIAKEGDEFMGYVAYNYPQIKTPYTRVKPHKAMALAQAIAEYQGIDFPDLESIKQNALMIHYVNRWHLTADTTLPNGDWFRKGQAHFVLKQGVPCLEYERNMRDGFTQIPLSKIKQFLE